MTTKKIMKKTSNDAARSPSVQLQEQQDQAALRPAALRPTGSPHRLRPALPPAGAVDNQASTVDFRNASTDPVPVEPESAPGRNVPPDSVASANVSQYLAVEIIQLREGSQG